jgi:hypothetical protein
VNNLIELGKTTSRTIMMMVLEAGGEARSTKASRRTLIFAASAIRQPVSFPEEYWPTEATLYLPPEAKLTAWQVDAIWDEVNEYILVREDGKDLPLESTTNLHDRYGPFLVIPPEPARSATACDRRQRRGCWGKGIGMELDCYGIHTGPCRGVVRPVVVEWVDDEEGAGALWCGAAIDYAREHGAIEGPFARLVEQIATMRQRWRPTLKIGWNTHWRQSEMPNDFNSNTENKDEWLTPPEIIKALGPFDLDPCAPTPETRPWDTATNHFCVRDNGLAQPWEGRVWCNPPYGRETFKWLDKLADHDGGGIALIFARTETVGFHRSIWAKAHSVFFFKGRLRFYHVTGEKGGTANAPSCLVSYSAMDTRAIAQSGLNGALVRVTRTWAEGGMTNLIKIGTTSDRALMMAVLQGGGELKSGGVRCRLRNGSLRKNDGITINGNQWFDTAWPIEATLYVSPETKFHAGDVLKLMEEDLSLTFKDFDDQIWFRGPNIPQCENRNILDHSFFTSGPFTLIPPAPQERDVFKEPRVGDEVALNAAITKETERNPMAARKRVVAVDSGMVYFASDPPREPVGIWEWTELRDTHTVTHRAEEGGGDE